MTSLDIAALGLAMWGFFFVFLFLNKRIKIKPGFIPLKYRNVLVSKPYFIFKPSYTSCLDA